MSQSPRGVTGAELRWSFNFWTQKSEPHIALTRHTKYYCYFLQLVPGPYRSQRARPGLCRNSPPRPPWVCSGDVARVAQTNSALTCLPPAPCVSCRHRAYPDLDCDRVPPGGPEELCV